MSDDGDGGALDSLLGSGDSDGDGDTDSGAERDASDAPADAGREGRHTVTVDLDRDTVGVYDLQRHRNGDVTAVVLASFGGGYQALALDVDSGGQVLEIEQIGDAEDAARAASMAEYWLDQHPNGILGPADDASGGGLLGVLRGAFGGDT